MILEVMPPLILTHVLEMIQEYKHISILALRRLVNFIRLFRLLLDLYPDVEKQMDANRAKKGPMPVKPVFPTELVVAPNVSEVAPNVAVPEAVTA